MTESPRPPTGQVIEFPPGGKRPHASERAADEATGLGMLIFFGSLSILFISSIIGCMIVLARLDGWQLPQRGQLVAGLWVSTGLLVALSTAIQLSYEALKRSQLARFRTLLWVSAGLALVFLGNQGLNWNQLLGQNLPPTARDLHVFAFYILTALHAVHVLGGLAAHAFVTSRARRGVYHAGKTQGVKSLTLYWHFLGAAWLVIHAAVQLMFLR